MAQPTGFDDAWDVHQHDIPKNFIAALRREGEAFGVRLEERAGRTFAVHREGHAHPLAREFTDVEAKLKDLDRRGLEGAVISPAPAFFGYGREAQVAAAMAALLNEGTAEMVREARGRLFGFAVVPLQAPQLALEELEQAVAAYGFRGVEIGSDAAGLPLSHPSLRPFFARCAALDLLVLVHPYFNGPKPRMERYYLTNLVGNPLDTTLSMVDVLLSGMLDEIPALRLLYVHGGGFLPYQLGRLAHGFAVRPEPRSDTASPPAESFSKLSFDTVTHSARALRFLVEMVGPERVFLGSDLPFDMADQDPLRTLLDAGLEPRAAWQIAGGNLRRHLARLPG